MDEKYVRNHFVGKFFYDLGSMDLQHVLKVKAEGAHSQVTLPTKTWHEKISVLSACF